MCENNEISTVMCSTNGTNDNILKDIGKLEHFTSLMLVERNVLFVEKTFAFVFEDLLTMLMEEKRELRDLAAMAITNMSSFECGASCFLEKCYSNTEGTPVPFLRIVIQLALERSCTISDRCCEILCNISTFRHPATHLTTVLIEKKCILENIIDAIISDNYNSEGCSLEHLSFMTGNLMQITEFRRYLLNNNEIINKLLPFIKKGKSLLKRRGIISLFRNCCFEIEYHEAILNFDFDILPYLLYPLTGPEQFDEDVYENLPPELQYLPSNKEREPDCESRKYLLEALYKLCSTSFGREFLRKKNTYHVLKFYHMWESDEANQALCEDVIGILIRTEEEIGFDNLSTVEIPGHLQEKIGNVGTTKD